MKARLPGAWVSFFCSIFIILVAVTSGLYPSRAPRPSVPKPTGQPGDEAVAAAAPMPTGDDTMATPTPASAVTSPAPTITPTPAQSTAAPTLTGDDTTAAATPAPAVTSPAPTITPAPAQSTAHTPTPTKNTLTILSDGNSPGDIGRHQNEPNRPLITARPPGFGTATGTPSPTASLRASLEPALSPTIAPSVTISRELGLSTQGWPIDVYEFGDGPIRLAFVGGIHGGYEWNTILLAYETIDYFTRNLETLPESISLYIIPSANPDGQAALTDHGGRFAPDEVGSDTYYGRFNGNAVDLNRNWDCGWEPVGYWRDREISAGSAPFSEVETQILRDFLTDMHTVVFWHSARPGVFFGECDSPFPASEALAAIYAEAAEYPVFDDFVDYSVTGAASDWLALQGIPAIAVELSNHTDTDWKRNLAGVLAIIETYRLNGRCPLSSATCQECVCLGQSPVTSDGATPLSHLHPDRHIHMLGRQKVFMES